MKGDEQLNANKISQKVALSTNADVLKQKEKSQDAITETNNSTKPSAPDLSQISELVNAVMPLAKEYVDFQKSKFDFTVKRDERASSHNRKLTTYLLVFMGIVILIMAMLTFLGKVSGDALLFMVGIVVGYLMNMIQGLLYSPWDNDEIES